jgi:FolB domain
MSTSDSNQTLMTIELKQVKLYGHHGVYKNEDQAGGEYEINLKVIVFPGDAIIAELNDTVNYVRLFELVKTRMKVPTALLETLVMEITQSIAEEFPSVKESEITIIKCNPPIENFAGKVAVTYKKKF